MLVRLPLRSQQLVAADHIKLHMVDSQGHKAPQQRAEPRSGTGFPEDAAGELHVQKRAVGDPPEFQTGSGFQRINIACPRSVLGEALERLKRI